MTKTLTDNDLCLLKAAGQLALTHGDNEFEDSAIRDELVRHKFEWSTVSLVQHEFVWNTIRLSDVINRMLELDLIEVREIGSLYRCAWTCGSSSTIELTIVPYNEELHTTVLKAVAEAVEKYGDLVDISGD